MNESDQLRLNTITDLIDIADGEDSVTLTFTQDTVEFLLGLIDELRYPDGVE